MTEYDALVKVLRVCGDSNKSCRDCHVENCPGYGEWEFAAEALMINAADAIEELSKPRWISVKERLPGDEFHYVLCCGAKGGMFVGWVSKYMTNGKATGFVHGGSGRNITHWMPLPQPPKEET